ncbi:MAG: chemotaxis protein CheD [Syntrophales bacterium LBB04]|nr:chemotaxis protein CheD [Syntrophales bacterium LBB04]
MDGGDIPLYEYYLPSGFIYLNAEPSLISTVVGSSVAVSLWDQKKKCGGMANYLYPLINNKMAATSQYGNVAVRHLIKMFLEEGTKGRDIKAQIFGGAETASPDGAKIARENVRVARNIFNKFKIEVVSEDVGGHMGRKVVFNTLKHEAIVYKVNSLRVSDWYPYLLGKDREIV